MGEPCLIRTMRHISLCKILLLSLLAMGCNEDDTTKATEREFVPGDKRWISFSCMN
jgi:hypothetical protein